MRLLALVALLAVGPAAAQELGDEVDIGPTIGYDVRTVDELPIVGEIPDELPPSLKPEGLGMDLLTCLWPEGCIQLSPRFCAGPDSREPEVDPDTPVIYVRVGFPGTFGFHVGYSMRCP